MRLRPWIGSISGVLLAWVLVSGPAIPVNAQTPCAVAPPQPPNTLRLISALRFVTVLSAQSPSGCWPDATNTGVPAGTALTPSGSITITTAGAVVSGLDINGTVNINANNVTFQSSRVTSNDFVVVRIQNGRTGVVIQDVEVNGVGTGNDGDNGIAGEGATIRRVNIYNVENGLTPMSSNSPMLLEDSYIHDLKSSGEPHYDGIQIDGGLANITIRHNTVSNPFGQTSAVMIDNWFGTIANVTVDNNRLMGGGYTVYSDGQFTGGSITGVSFTNNRLKKGQYGYSSINHNTNLTWSGNVDDVTGQPVSQ
jgi:hypothetical protein